MFICDATKKWKMIPQKIHFGPEKGIPNMLHPVPAYMVVNPASRFQARYGSVTTIMQCPKNKINRKAAYAFLASFETCWKIWNLGSFETHLICCHCRFSQQERANARPCISRISPHYFRSVPTSFPGCSYVIRWSRSRMNNLVHFDQIPPENGCISSHYGFAVCLATLIDGKWLLLWR